jgi:hypothetical protein
LTTAFSTQTLNVEPDGGGATCSLAEGIMDQL